MNDEWTTANSRPGPPPPAGPPRRLERSSSEKMVAGVAGGLGQYFGLDPVIFRIAFVVLALAGGSGVLLYVLAWALLPRQDQPRSALQTAVERPEKGKRIFAALVIVAASVALLSPGDFLFDEGKLIRLLGLAAIIAAVVWLVTSDESSPADRPPSAPPAPAAPTEPSQGPVWEGLAPEAAVAQGGDWDPEVTTPVAVPAEPGTAEPGTAGPGTAGPGTAEPGTAELRTAELQAPPPERPPAASGPPAGFAGPAAPTPATTRSLTMIVVSLLLVGAGVAVLTGVAAVAFLSLALLVVGLALLFGSRWGRSRGLIPVGVVLVVALGAASAIELVRVPLRGGAGERVLRPLSLFELRDDYELGAGELRLDLSALDFSGSDPDDDVEIDARIGVGSLTVVVPTGVDVVVDAKVGMGEIDILGERAQGPGLERRVERRAFTRGPVRTLELDLEAGMGQLQVRRAAG